MAGSIIKRGERTWLVRVSLGRDPEGKRRNLNKTIHGTKKDALTYLHQVLRDRDLGVLSEPSTQPVNAYLDLWLEQSARKRTRAQSAQQYETLLRLYVRPELGHLRLDQVKRAHVQQLYHQLGRLSPASLKAVHRVLRQAFGQAVRWGYLAQDPTQHVETSRGPRRPISVWDADQAERFLRSLPPFWDALLGLALGTGMRPGEYLALDWASLDLEAGAVSVTRNLVELRGERRIGDVKTAAGRRRILLPPSLSRLLRDHRQRVLEMRLAAGPEWEHHDLVFPGPSGGPRWRSMVADRFARLARAARVPPIRLYDLRHTHASLLLLAGLNPKVVSERLGHASVSITLDVYSHVLPSLQEEAAGRLEGLLWSAPGKGTQEVLTAPEHPDSNPGRKVLRLPERSLTGC